MSQLLKPIDPWRAAEQGVYILEAIHVSSLTRLLDLLAEPSGMMQCELTFYRDERRRQCVKSRVWGELQLICQRCLQPVAVKIDVESLLALVQGDTEAKRLPTEYEPLMVDDPMIRPLDIMEDEILLALPHAPKHQESKNCNIKIDVSPMEAPVVDEFTENATVAEKATQKSKLSRNTVYSSFQDLEQIKKQLH